MTNKKEICQVLMTYNYQENIYFGAINVPNIKFFEFNSLFILDDLLTLLNDDIYKQLIELDINAIYNQIFYCNCIPLSNLIKIEKVLYEKYGIKDYLQYHKDNENIELPKNFCYTLVVIKKFIDDRWKRFLSDKKDKIYKRTYMTNFELEKIRSDCRADFTLQFNEAESHMEERSFIYDCYSSADIVIAIFHCFIFNNFKFKKCTHCGRYFATSGLRFKYCNRKSPVEGYTHLECEAAVRDIWQAQNRKVKKIIGFSEKSNANNELLSFAEDNAAYINTIDNFACVDEINKYNKFLDKYIDIGESLKYRRR